MYAVQFKDEDFEIATATTTEEIRQLGQVGFVKYDELNGIHFYRELKRLGVTVMLNHLKVLMAENAELYLVGDAHHIFLAKFNF